MLKDVVKRVYERFWGDIHFQRRAEWYYIQKWLNPERGEEILDLACGGGFYSRKIAQNGCYVSGIDLGIDVIALANKYNNVTGVTYKVANAEKLPFASASFDKIFSVSSIEHFNNDMLVFKELFRVLRNGGSIVISVDSFHHPDISPNIRNKHARTHYIKTFYTKESITSKLSLAGFKVEKVKYILNSKVSSVLMRFWIVTGFSRWGLVIFPIAYPLTRLADMVSKTDKGYVIVLKAIKPY